MTTFISFSVGRENFAMDIGRIREVCNFSEAVRVPQAPPHILGLVNLRGRAVPVMDLGLRMSTAAIGSRGRELIVVEVQDDQDPWLMGLLVETILGLEEAGPEDIAPPPQMPGNVGRFITGIFRANGYYLLDTQKLCTP